MNTRFGPLDTEISSKYTYLRLLSNQELVFIQGSLMPIVKLNEGRYMIGTRIKEIIQRNNGLYVRNGGGFMKLEEFISKCGSTESLRIEKIILYLLKKAKRLPNGEIQEPTFSDAVMHLLKMNKFSTGQIQRYLKTLSIETNDLFKYSLRVLKENN